MPSRLKMLMAEELKSHHGDQNEFVVVGHTKLGGVETAALRARLRERGVTMRVVKNSIATRVLAESGHGDAAKFVEGPCALVTGECEFPEVCKALSECVKEFGEKLTIRGGFMDDSPLGPAAVDTLSKIPPMPVLQAQILAGIQAPVVGLASAFQSLLRSIACALEGIRKQKEEEPAPAAP